ncbi:MAG: lamin tail domain-containing protein, partial [Verrucomicrobia bacterium]|nr:lamin tail domain-containing protein [Verrucomicrobiota bacterium]
MAINDTTLMDVDGDYEDWIEIHNDSASPVNLAGWFLTDNATELDKWRFPSIVLEADQYLVVFASSKDRRNPRAELHTNFKLSGGGEYLALVQPDGTVAYDYYPEYPAQAADISYGTVGGGPAKPLGQGAPANANSPISVSEFNTDYDGWNTPEFIGATESASVTVTWDSSTTYSTSESTSDDQHKLSHGYLDDGNTGSGNGLEVTLSGIPYATYRVYGLVASDGSNGGSSYPCLDFNVNGTWVYGVTSPSTTTAYGNVNANSSHNGEPWTQIVPGSVIGNYWTVETSGSTCSIIGLIRDYPARGSLTGVIIEPTGAASGALISIDFARDTSDAFSGGQNIGPLATDSSNWKSTLDRDSGDLITGSMTFDVTTSGWQSGHTGIGYERDSGYGSLIGDNGNVEALTFNKNASIFVRIPFTISDTNSLAQFTLRMKYDDGFRAFLNGTEVAADNAPTPAGWNSTATADRDDSLNGDWAAFDLTSHISLLETGDNLLAIQGFNYTADSPDLLVLPELDAVYDVALSSSYLYEASPGAENGPGSMEIGPSIRDTTDQPPRPNGGTGAPALVIISQVLETLHPIQSVSLHYRYMYGTETTVPMTLLSNDLYTASIPLGGLGEGQMVRWRVEASDTSGYDTTDPLYLDSEDYEQYYGTSTIDTSYSDSKLPVVEWFVEDYGAANTDGGTRCSIYYLDRFYDHVFIGKRGGVTSGFDKRSLKLDFNKDNRFTYREGENKVKDLRWMTNYSDKTKVHNTMSHETSKRVGAPYHFTFPVRIQRNGAFDRIAEFMV